MKTTIHVALLRGINVGGKSTVPMSRLKKCIEEVGFSSVQTYINSGNVVFSAEESNPRKIEALVEDALERAFGFRIAVAVRTQADIEDLLDNVPESWRSDAGRKHNVIFLRPAIDSPHLVERFGIEPGIEELHYRPGALFWAAQTSNFSKTQMSKVSRMPLYKEMTVRTLATVEKIHQLMRARAH